MSIARPLPSVPVVCGLVLAVLASLCAAPSEPAGEERLAALRAELGKAEREQDRGRLRALYSEAASLAPGNPRFQRGLGLACYLDGDYAEAVEALERAASLQPDLAGVRLYLGISYYRTNRFPEALVELEGSPELAAGDPAARYWQGAAYRALGRLSDAINALELARSKARANLEVLQLLTRSYAEHSSEWFRHLLSVDETSPPSRLLKAEELAMDGAGQAALRELDAALDEAPGLAGLHRVRGQVLWSRGEYEAGADEFRLELKNNPFSAEAHVRLGSFLLDLGDPAAALGHLRLARRYAPGDERTTELLDQALRAGATTPDTPQSPEGTIPASGPTLESALGSYREADATSAALQLERVLAERPEATDAMRLLVRCYLAESRFGEAAEQLRAVLAQHRDDPETLYLLGRTYEGLAAATAEEMFELDPGSSRVRLLRGEALERGPRYDFERALAEFRGARELDSGDPGVHHAIGRVLFKMKRFDEAIPHLQDALALNRSHGMANYLLGKIRLAQGDRTGAIESLRSAVSARPGLADAQRDLARALVLEGRMDEGISIYERLVAEHPTDASLRALLAAAYRRAGHMEKARAEAQRAQALRRTN